MSLRRCLVFAICLASVVSAPTAHAQITDQLEVWDINLGTEVATIPASAVRLIACGTNGGPPSRPLADFTAFMTCAPEASGLREVHFAYDDEQEYIARAHENGDLIARLTGTRVFGFESIVSLLVDEAGIIQGIRVVTDPRAQSLAERDHASDLGEFIKSRFGSAGWECVDHPPREGYNPANGLYVDRTCTLTRDDAVLTMVQHHYRKPGQQLLDPVENVLQPGYLESTTRFEMMPAEPIATAVALEWAEAETADRSAVLDCPGCDLSGANLKRLDLSGANLAGANLAGANLHDANLTGANLAGADLSGANLNKARLLNADLSGATLTGAMLFRADLSAANVADADLSATRMGESRWVRANASGAVIAGSNVRAARFADANLAGANLSVSILLDAIFSRADLTGAVLDGSVIANGELQGAILVGASMRGVDLYGATLRDANLTDADIRGSRLTASNTAGAITEGALFEGSLMPNGRIYQGN
ncbi:MAG: pentapeptide repeat-containing protein [Bauldia sp.]|nr:pentapeptide repeat-containing protein [Bauldia sp.]